MHWLTLNQLSPCSFQVFRQCGIPKKKNESSSGFDPLDNFRVPDGSLEKLSSSSEEDLYESLAKNGAARDRRSADKQVAAVPSKPSCSWLQKPVAVLLLVKLYGIIRRVMIQSDSSSSNLHYSRSISPKRATSGEAHFRGLAPEQRSFVETSQRRC